MQFRYREVVYRPDFYIFHNDDQEEWFPNGIFNYNVSRMIRDLEAYEKDSAGVSWLYAAVKISVSIWKTVFQDSETGSASIRSLYCAGLKGFNAFDKGVDRKC